ncbi:EexN family lipoprotein [Variovorax sp. J22G21]|uniref:EexN family lipoprotein n=1 Tax=Variovorax fucosicus TaxID=3053517 RepID=UPI00257572B1|nr:MULTISPECIES: EexN family lipoprotein [unclassified Variovorax]MDM0042852.1 EexN family lipoprotein [Variovorax sp. J22R193]MDM0064921.1 EexN family lipoprotein [Variovorax sp. J22G21]
MILATVAAALVAACSKPAPIESVESLVANPERLKELRVQCKADHAKVGDAQCNAVAEATRQRFFGSGGSKHTPPASPPATFSPAAASAPAAPSIAPPSPKD